MTPSHWVGQYQENVFCDKFQVAIKKNKKKIGRKNKEWILDWKKEGSRKWIIEYYLMWDVIIHPNRH